jgi:hypothetical protein
MDPWGDRRFQAWKERLFGTQSINQSINQSIKKKNLGLRGGETERSLLFFVGIIIVGGFVLWS